MTMPSANAPFTPQGIRPGSLVAIACPSSCCDAIRGHIGIVQRWVEIANCWDLFFPEDSTRTSHRYGADMLIVRGHIND